MARSKNVYWAGKINDLPSVKDHFDHKRERRTRYQQTNLPNVDVYGILFAIVAVVFILYPLAQYFLGL